MSTGSSSQRTYRQQQVVPSSNSSTSYFGKILDGGHRLHGNGDHHHDLELRAVPRVMSHFRMIGFFTGVTVQLVSLAGQLISLGVVTKVGMSFGDDSQVLQEAANEVGITSAESILRGFLWIISHMSLALWPVVWMIPFILSMTDTGSAWAQKQFIQAVKKFYDERNYRENTKYCWPSLQEVEELDMLFSLNNIEFNLKIIEKT